MSLVPWLNERRGLLKSVKLGSGREQFEATAIDMLAAVRQQGLEGVIAKRKDSLYEPAKRSGSWVKYRVNRAQELVIGGYIPGPTEVIRARVRTLARRFPTI